MIAFREEIIDVWLVEALTSISQLGDFEVLFICSSSMLLCDKFPRKKYNLKHVLALRQLNTILNLV